MRLGSLWERSAACVAIAVLVLGVVLSSCNRGEPPTGPSSSEPTASAGDERYGVGGQASFTAAVATCGGESSAGNPYPCCDNKANCTWYMWKLAKESWGESLPGWGNAGSWAGAAPASRVGKYPAVDTIMALTDVGHVAWVTAVNCQAGTVSVQEMNCCDLDPNARLPKNWRCGGSYVDEATAKAIAGPRGYTWKTNSNRKYIFAKGVTPVASDPCASGGPAPKPTPTPTPTPAPAPGPAAAAPQIKGISPGSVVGSRFDLTIDGQGFDAAAVDQVYQPNGQYMGSGALTSRASTRLVVHEAMEGAAPGTYTVKVRNGNGQLSNGVTLTLRAEVSLSPTTGSAGTTLTLTGRGFSGRHGATTRIRRPDGSEAAAVQVGTDASGQFTRRIDSSGFAAGSYEAWAVDDATRIASNRVGFSISGPLTPSQPKITSVSPSSVVGSEFTMTIDGQGFDASGAIDQVYQPGGSFMGNGVVLSRSSTRLIVRQAMAGAAPVSYTVRILNPGGRLSNAVSFRLYAEVAVAPSSGKPGTLFSYTGSGFTGRYGVTSHLRRPDGSEFGTLQIPTNAQGHFTHTINSAGFAPGTYEVWAEDNNTRYVTARTPFRVQ